jgi:hypothetical protein
VLAVAVVEIVYKLSERSQAGSEVSEETFNCYSIKRIKFLDCDRQLDYLQVRRQIGSDAFRTIFKAPCFGRYGFFEDPFSCRSDQVETRQIVEKKLIG